MWFIDSMHLEEVMVQFKGPLIVIGYSSDVLKNVKINLKLFWGI